MAIERAGEAARKPRAAFAARGGIG